MNSNISSYDFSLLIIAFQSSSFLFKCKAQSEKNLKSDLNFFDVEQTKENTEADWIFFNLNRREIGIPTRGLIVEIHIYFF